jgi:tight adherence protein B
MIAIVVTLAGVGALLAPWPSPNRRLGCGTANDTTHSLGRGTGTELLLLCVQRVSQTISHHLSNAHQAFSSSCPSRLLVGECVVIAIATTLVLSPVIAAVLVALVVVAQRLAVTRRLGRDHDRQRAALLHHVQSAAAVARSGGDGLGALIVGKPQVSGVVDGLRLALSSHEPEPSLRAWQRQHCGVDGVDDVALVLLLSRRTGAPFAELLDVATACVRHRVASQAELKALSAQARASSTIVVLAPLVFAGVAASIDRRIADTLFHTRLGWVTLVVALVFDAIGLIWMRRLSQPAGIGPSVPRPRPWVRNFSRSAGVGLAVYAVLGTNVLLMGIAALGVWATWRRPAVRQINPEAELHLATAADRLALCVAAGMTTTEALDAVGSLGSDRTSRALDLAYRRWRLGESLDDALRHAEADESANASALVSSLRVDVRYGGPLRDRLREVAGDARQRARRASETHARAASVRMLLPLACCVLPAFALVVLVPTVVVAIETIGGLTSPPGS